MAFFLHDKLLLVFLSRSESESEPEPESLQTGGLPPISLEAKPLEAHDQSPLTLNLAVMFLT